MPLLARSVVVVLVCAGTLTSGCAADPVDLAVVLETDLPPVTGFERVLVDVSRPDEGPFAQSEVDSAALEMLADPAAFTDGEVVGEFEELATGSYLVRVSLFARDGRTRALRAVPIDITEDTVLTLSILASCGGGDGASCRDTGTATAECAGGACSALGCVCAEVDIGCTADSDCIADVSCGIGQCIEERCFVTAGPGCAADEFCDPLSGCVPVSLMPPEPADCTAVDPMVGLNLLHECDIDTEIGDIAGGCAATWVTTDLRTGVDALSRADIDTAVGTTLEIIIGVCDATGYVFHLGNSATNDGRSGDAGTTVYDSEMQIDGAEFSIYTNDVAGSSLEGRVTDFVPTDECVTRRIVVRDREVQLPDVSETFAGDGIFRVDEPGESHVFLGLNGVITGRADRLGSGTRCARLRIYE